MSEQLRLGVAPHLIGNPHKVPAEYDRLFPARHDIPGFSETALLTSWNPVDGVGVFIHVGRCPQDIELWYAQTLAWLPGGKIAVDRSWGRSSHPGTIETGAFFLEMCEEPGKWRSTYDGAAEISNAATMSRRPTGSGAARPMRWSLTTEAAGPLWDLYAGRNEEKQDWAQGTHTQQIMKVTGDLWVDGEHYSLDGFAGNDHSSGPRNLSSFASEHFLIGAFPDLAVHCISVFDHDGSPLIEAGALIGSGDQLHEVTLVDVDPLSRLDTCEPSQIANFRSADGALTPVRFDVLHHFPLCLNELNDNVNGIEWDGRDQLVLTEARVRMTRLTDHAVGYANLERSTLRSRVAPCI